MLITFEGLDGCGKTTQASMVYSALKARGEDVILTSEPGADGLRGAIRQILTDRQYGSMEHLAELLLLCAARAQHIGELIIPALHAGKIILCDRFVHSTIAYQGYGDGVSLTLIRRLGRIATRGLKPDLTILLDLSPEKGLERIRGKRDRVEKRSLAYHKRVRKGYLKLANRQRRRIKVIPVKSLKMETQKLIRKEVDRCLSNL